MGKRRKIHGLKTVKAMPHKPAFIPKHHPKKQSVRAGLIYEKKLADYLAAKYGEDNVTHGLWIEYYDVEGKGWAQPDIIVEGEEMVIIVEAKLTYTPRAAKSKLFNIYLPLVGRLYPNKTIRCVQACCNLSNKAAGQPIVKSLDQIFTGEVELKFVNYHWRPL